jgi:hypothetical protein
MTDITDQKALEALARLIRIAKSDTGQSAKVANFLLAWWNAGSCGGFDFTDLWGVDTAIAKDMVAVVALIAAHSNYPDAYGFRADFERMVADWRPRLVEGGE